MARMPYLQTRGDVWYVYRRVPADIRPFVNCEFIRASLKTGDKAEARRRVVRHIADTDNQFELIRSGQWPPVQPEDYLFFAREFATWLSEELAQAEPATGRR